MTTKEKEKPICLESIQAMACEIIHKNHLSALEELDAKNRAKDKEEEKWALTVLSHIPKIAGSAASKLETKAQLLNLTEHNKELYTFAQGPNDQTIPVAQGKLVKLLKIAEQMKGFNFFLQEKDQKVFLMFEWQHPSKKDLE